ICTHSGGCTTHIQCAAIGAS
ncbi:hypothetical protein BIW11_02665, partial [Tropilaelaps mercedesae]